jgi:hypothetical protein
LKHILADFVDLLAKTSIKSTYCQHFWNEKSVSDSLPRYGSQNRIAAMISYKMVGSRAGGRAASGVKLLWIVLESGSSALLVLLVCFIKQENSE